MYTYKHAVRKNRLLVDNKKTKIDLYVYVGIFDAVSEILTFIYRLPKINRNAELQSSLCRQSYRACSKRYF